MENTVLSLLRQHAWNATAYQIVNPGITLWFSPEKTAVIGYQTHQRVRVVAGAPVCAESDLEQVLEQFEAEARVARQSVCYFGAAGRLFYVLSPKYGYSTVVLGAQPCWNPQHWVPITQRRRSLRSQHSRASNKGVIVREWYWQDAQRHPALQRLLSEWLARKSLPSLHFLVEPQTLAVLEDKRIFVASLAEKPIAFVNLSPIPTRKGWLTEQFVRGKDAPNGAIEMLIDAAICAIARDGAEYVTMGLVPLSSGTWNPAHYNPLWLRFTLAWVRAHGHRFYNFAGLETFKAKFDPDYWEPIYAISHEKHFSPRTLWAIADAFSDHSVPSTILRGAVKALRQEIRNIRN